MEKHASAVYLNTISYNVPNNWLQEYLEETVEKRTNLTFENLGHHN